MPTPPLLPPSMLSEPQRPSAAFERPPTCPAPDWPPAFRSAEEKFSSHILAQEAGKPIKTARIEVEPATIRTFISAAKKPSALRRISAARLDAAKNGAGRWGLSALFRLGQIAGIGAPFNFPVKIWSAA